MVRKKHKIVWDNSAKAYLKQSIQYIRQSSPQNADKIKIRIKQLITEIPEHPERYPADKYRINNTRDYRAFVADNLLISYYIGVDEIRIVRVRHSKQSPQEY